MRATSGGVHRDLTRTPWWYHAALRPAFHLLLALVFGCARGAGAPSALGEATREAPEPATAKPSAPTPPVAEWLARAKDWPTVSERPLSSAHLGRPQRAELRVNPEARAGYLALVTDTAFADGTWLVEFLSDAKSGVKGPTFALERRAGRWNYWELDAEGRVQAQGDLPYCANCHAGAPSAPVFGLPRSDLAQESNAAAARSPK